KLVEVKRRQFFRDQIRLIVYVAEMVGGGDGELLCIVQTRIKESPFAVQFKIGKQRVPVRDCAPVSGPGVKIDASQSECWGNEDRGRLAIGTKFFAIEEQLGVEFARPPAGQHFLHGWHVGAEDVGYWLQVGRKRHDLSSVQVLVRPAVEAMSDHTGRNSGGRKGVVNTRVAERALQADRFQLSFRIKEAGYAQDGVQFQQRQRVGRII